MGHVSPSKSCIATIMALVPFLPTHNLLALALVGSGLMLHASGTQAQEVELSEPDLSQFQQLEIPQTENSQADPNDFRPLTQDTSVLSIQGGARMIRDAGVAVSNQDYDSASASLQDARRVFNQLTNFYQELSATFVGINSTISEEHRLKAVESAEMRDEASYQLALVHRAQNKPELAVPLLIQIIRSQNPASDLGQLAYQQLFELGFVDIPFEWEGASTLSPSR